ncbi:MAG: heavy-metal-associated domain-containing protein [Kiloniellaceae bacterium]
MIRLKVEGMTCGHCVKTVRQALSSVPGVARVVEVDLDRGEALVDGDLRAEALLAAVQKKGYEARVA